MGIRTPARRRNRPIRRLVGRGARFACSLVLLIGAALAGAHGLEIKVASVAPENSPFGEALNQIAADWSRISGGSIQLRVYHNGIAGDQADMLRKIRIGQLQGGVFTSSGLSTVVDESLDVSVPFLIRNDAELAYVMSHISDSLDASALRHGYEALAWVPSGWLHFFSRAPIRTPDDLKAQKIGVSPEQPQLFQAFNLLGYHPVTVGIPETLSSLNSGLADVILTSPLAAAGYQWFAVADNMLDADIAPFLGAILLSAQTWQRIPADLRPQLEDEVQRVARDLAGRTKALEQQAINTMESYGLHRVEMTAQQRDAWSQEFTRSYPKIVGTAFSPGMFDTIQKLLEQYRK